MSFESTGKQSEVEAAVTEHFLDMLGCESEALTVTVSSRTARSVRAAAARSLTQWDVYFEVVADEQTAQEHAAVASAMSANITGANTTGAGAADALSQKLAQRGVWLDVSTLAMEEPEIKVVTATMTTVSVTGTTVTLTGTSTTLTVSTRTVSTRTSTMASNTASVSTSSTTPPATTLSSTATAAASTSVTTASTRTDAAVTTSAASFVVRQQLSFSSTGTREEVQAAVVEALQRSLGVASEQLTVAVSEASASRAASGRRLGATEWQVDYEVRTAGAAEAAGVMQAAEALSVSPHALAQDLADALSSRGLRLEEGSVAAARPQMTAGPQDADQRAAGDLAAEPEQAEAGVDLAVVVVPVGVALLLCALGVLAALYARRRRRRLGSNRVAPMSSDEPVRRLSGSRLEDGELGIVAAPQLQRSKAHQPPRAAQASGAAGRCRASPEPDAPDPEATMEVTDVSEPESIGPPHGRLPHQPFVLVAAD